LIIPTSGHICVNGVELSKIPLKVLRSRIGIVSQESILFSGTIKENILLGNSDASEKELLEALKLANCEFVMDMPDKYDTQVGDRGTKLSGGQRQRLAIARAIIKNPDILILDEATSSLDAESEKHVQYALNNILGRQTTIIIAHRFTTIKSTSRIIVLNEGQIIEQGTHKELTNSETYYKKLYELQT
jgi:subfamily B ATP-binding cassette protein MsbA